MNFLALICGLGLERLLTHLFHLRAFHWLDPVFDGAFRNIRISQPNVAIAAAILLVAIVVIPVGLVELSLQGRLMHIPQFVFAVVVLLFCLGPRDLAETVSDYCSASEANDGPRARKIAAELVERDVAAGEDADIELAIYAQANNRIFAVVFWFILLGPTGAWMFRVMDLMQRRAAHYAQSTGSAADADRDSWPRVAAAAVLVHRIFAWVPGHLLALGYVLAGSYDGAAGAWRSLEKQESTLFPGPTDQLLGAVGSGAAVTDPEADESERAHSAMGQVERTLWFIWCPILALMTLYDLLS
jgi:AmpE protein